MVKCHTLACIFCDSAHTGHAEGASPPANITQQAACEYLVPGEAPVEERFEVVGLQSNGLTVLLNGSSKVALLAQAVPLGMVLVS